MADKNNFNCNFKENVGKVVVILAKKIAAMEVNSSCPLFAIFGFILALTYLCRRLSCKNKNALYIDINLYGNYGL